MLKDIGDGYNRHIANGSRMSIECAVKMTTF